jgi:hypothetical protein
MVVQDSGMYWREISKTQLAIVGVIEMRLSDFHESYA